MKIKHHIPGRLRLERNSITLEKIQKLSGVLTITESGNSVIIQYNTSSNFVNEFDQLTEAHHLTELDELFEVIEDEANYLKEHSDGAKFVIEAIEHLDTNIRKSTNNLFDLKLGLVGGLAVATIVGIGLEAATPVWVTISIFGVHHFFDIHKTGKTHE